MNGPVRYKSLLSYLPGMATVVNAFQSPQVQAAVYESLMSALEAKLEQEGAAAAPNGTNGKGVAQLLKESDRVRKTNSSSIKTNLELAHDLVEGESIHSTSEELV